jgi:cytochrome P450
LCGLFTAEGEDWKRERRFVGPALNHKNVKNYLPSVKLVTSRLLEKWENYSEMGGRAIAINDDMYSVAMDIVSLVSFSQDLNSLNTSTNLIQTMVKYVEITWKRALSPIPYWDIPIIGQYLDGGKGTIKKVNEHCLHAIAELEKSTKAVGGNESEKAKKSQSFLAKMLVLNKKAEAPLITERMIGNMLTLVIAGYETTAVTLCSSMYAIAEDQTGLQEELAQEAMLIKSIEDADLETFLTGLPRLRSFMYEVLRLKGAIQSGSFLSTVPIEIDGTVLPAASRFVVLWKYISTLENSAAGKSAPRGPRDAPLSKFCGRRWLTGSPASPSTIKPTFKSGFRPFGEGARVCPGRELAETEILVILSSILRKFEISLEPGHPPLKLVTQLAQAPGCEIKLVFNPRMAL